LPREQLLTVVDVLNQSTTMMTRRNSEAQLATLRPEDLLVQPMLAGFGATDFARAEQLIDAGYRAADALGARLATMRSESGGNLSLSLARSAEPRNPLISAVRIENDSKV
ncbi:MAG TPA: hypothetical protein DCX38_05960, partial [Pseudomonas sp.]|nr:hypothetical protein [Pseudomonas sp.]